MATDYDLIPSLIERITASQLVVIVAGGHLVDLQRDRMQEPPRVLGMFEVDVEEVLDGDPPPDRLLVRVLGEGQDEKARWLVPLTGARRSVLLLTRDIGPEVPEGVYAPVFASGFAIEDDTIELPPEAVDQRTRELAQVRDGRTTVDKVRQLIRAVRREQAEARQELEELLPPEALSRPYPNPEELPPEVTEIPPTVTGGIGPVARPTEIGRAPEADSR